MSYFLLFILSIIVTYILKVFAPYVNLVDKPNERKIHKGSIPLVGGPVILFILLISLTIYNYDPFIILIIFSSIIIFIFGLLDDIFNLRVISRLISQFLAVSILVGSGFIIKDFGFFEINNNFLFLSIIFTAIAIVGLTNSINFIDGLDGLCSSMFILSLLSLITILILKGSPLVDLQIIIILLIIISAFLLMNLNIFFVGKVFLGDSGSISLGFILSCLLIYFSQFSSVKINPEVVVWCVTLPVFDFFTVSIKRIISKKKPFNPDRTHIHHLLLINNFSQYKVLIIIITLSLILNISGFLIYYYLGSIISFFSYITFFIIYFYVNYKNS